MTWKLQALSLRLIFGIVMALIVAAVAWRRRDMAGLSP
jgi:hypothetical protein